jgi:hypothetical protein
MVDMPNFRWVLAIVAIGCGSHTTNPTSCEPGTWHDDTAPSTACVAWTDCPAGTYIAGDGTATTDRICAVCGDGTFSTSTNAASCAAWSDCPTGTYVAGDGSATSDRVCTTCADGTFSTAPNAALCATWSYCGPGEYVSTAGTTTNNLVCGACQAGSFSATTDASACAPWTTCTGFFNTTGTSTTNAVCGPNVLQTGTMGYNAADGIALDSNGNIYIVGDTTGAFPTQTNVGNYDAFLLQYDASGTLQWARQFGTNTVDSAMAVTVDANNNIYVVGYTYGTFPGQTNAGGDDAYLAKYDATGTQQWAHQFGTSGSDYAYAVAVDGSNYVYVSGSTYGAFPAQSTPDIPTPSSRSSILAARCNGCSSGARARSTTPMASGSIATTTSTPRETPTAKRFSTSTVPRERFSGG